MFDLAWSEIALIGVVALVVIGPKDLPEAIHGVARGISKLRRRFEDASSEPHKIKTIWGRGYLFSPSAWDE